MRALTAPYCPKICLIPIAPTKGGRIIGMRTAELRNPLSGYRKRSEIVARGSAIRRAIEVPAHARRKELRSAVR